MDPCKRIVAIFDSMLVMNQRSEENAIVRESGSRSSAVDLESLGLALGSVGFEIEAHPILRA
jgi:hypothetical protein